jgi:Ca2+-binding EF-hand superfamily protein
MTRRNWLLAIMSVSGFAIAQRLGADAQQDKFAAANQNVKELLLLMDTDKSGKISKREWMNFMEAEFNRLDRDGSGELDLNELRQSGLSFRRPKP